MSTNNDHFHAAWERHKNSFKDQHPGVSDEDLVYEIGQEGKMLEKLEQKSGKTKDEISEWLSVMG